jgi:hypothetical protein
MFTFHLKGTPFKTGFDLSNLSISEISTLLKDYRKDPEAEEETIKKLEHMIRIRAKKVARQRNIEKEAEAEAKEAEVKAKAEAEAKVFEDSSDDEEGGVRLDIIEGGVKLDTIKSSSSSHVDHSDAPNA